MNNTIDNKILDFDKDIDSFTSDLISNIESILKEYGETFFLRAKGFLLPVILTKVVIDTNKTFIYKLAYNSDKLTTFLKPFEIQFIDPITKKIGENTYISNIHKTHGISGSQIVEIVLHIQRQLSVKKTYLWDGASIMCGDKEIDLSILKLIERGSTFYMKLGFDYELTGDNDYDMRFNSISELKNKLNEIIQKIREIKIDSLIDEYKKTLDMMCDVIKNQSYQNLDIEYYRGSPTIFPVETYHSEEPFYEVTRIISECKTVLDILNKTNKVYLYEYLIELFNDSMRCYFYIDLYTCLVWNDQRHKILIGGLEKNMITRTYPILFSYLSRLRHAFMFSFDFSKKS